MKYTNISFKKNNDENEFTGDYFENLNYATISMDLPKNSKIPISDFKLIIGWVRSQGDWIIEKYSIKVKNKYIQLGFYDSDFIDSEALEHVYATLV